jgi:hypothetical protein
MENANIGIVNLIISNKLKDSYFNDKLIEESKKIAFDFLDIIKSSPILQLEFKVFNNMENKHIENDVVATRYIDNNIKLFEVYTIQEINAAHEKLATLYKEVPTFSSQIEQDKLKLYEAIDNLIRESLQDYDNINVDNIHESFTLVLNHIKTQRKSLIENIEIKPIEEDVIEIAVNKFNERYESLDENDRNLLTTLIKSNDKEKQTLLEIYKTETLTILESINKDNSKDSVVKAIQKIKEMIYKQENVDDSIISLHELKKELL